MDNQYDRLDEIVREHPLNNTELLDFLRTTTIPELDIRGNRFTGNFREGFLQAMQENDTFTDLYMDTDDVGFATMRGLYDILADKPHFRLLHIDRNPHSRNHAHRILGDNRVVFHDRPLL